LLGADRRLPLLGADRRLPLLGADRQIRGLTTAGLFANRVCVPASAGLFAV